ncbi:MAG: EAL domain-containing protein, partial [Gemmatimonadota bacterium]
VVHADSGDPMGLEALVRWTHPRLGLLHPSEFPPATGNVDLIRSLDRRVLQMAVRQAATWNHRRRPFGWIAVNLSGSSLDDFEFVDYAYRLLQHYPDVSPGEIVVEVSQQDVLHPTRLDVLRRVSTVVGLPILVDGFRNSGPARAELRDAPISFLKLDREFARAADSAGPRRAEVESIVGLGRDLEATVIAQGVETDRQVRWFRSLGVDALQGYHFGHPDEAASIEASLLGG